MIFIEIKENYLIWFYFVCLTSEAGSRYGSQFCVFLYISPKLNNTQISDYFFWVQLTYTWGLVWPCPSVNGCVQAWGPLHSPVSLSRPSLIVNTSCTRRASAHPQPECWLASMCLAVVCMTKINTTAIILGSVLGRPNILAKWGYVRRLAALFIWDLLQFSHIMVLLFIVSFSVWHLSLDSH